MAFDRRAATILIQTNLYKTPQASHSDGDILGIATRERENAWLFSQPTRLETVLSIHACTSLLISRTSRPAGSIGGPMTTRTVPGLFIHPRRGQ